MFLSGIFCAFASINTYLVFFPQKCNHAICIVLEYNVLEIFPCQGKERSLTLFNSCRVFHNLHPASLINPLPTDGLSECFQLLSNATELTHLGLTEGPLIHGQPDERQSGGRIGLRWQRWVLGAPPPCPGSPWPQGWAQDNIWKVPPTLPDLTLPPCCSDKCRWGWKWADRTD